MTARFPMKDQVAIVGIGQTQYARTLEGRTPMSLALEASKLAIRDAGLRKEDIDGVVGTEIVDYQYIREGLGIPQTNYALNGMRSGGAAGLLPPLLIAPALYAVFSGACETALVAYSHARAGRNSSSAPKDPLREVNVPRPQLLRQHAPLDDYASWAGRYLYDYKVPRQVFGFCAVNNRTNAALDEGAVLKKPLTFEEYLAEPMLRDPLCKFDMDLPVDGGDALIVTTVERARKLGKKPVYVHAVGTSEVEHSTPHNEQGSSYTSLGHFASAKTMWERSDLKLTDVDVFYPYDGFSNVWTGWHEAVGYCRPGEAWQFFNEHWDKKENRLKINGRVIVSSHGGSMSHGASQGFSYFHEAVLQLRGDAGPRQVTNAKVALVTAGAFFFNATAYVLRAD